MAGSALRAGAAALLLPVLGLSAGGTGPATPPARVATYVPRVHVYGPRVARYQPRIVDVTPAVTSPSTETVGSDVLFAFDSSTLGPTAQAVLGQVVQRLQQAPAGVVVVTGYTDSVGDAGYNQALSGRRAVAVQQYLAVQVARPGLTYQAVGMGAADPVAPNTNPDGSDDPAGRAQDRRVTITVPS